MTPKTSILSHTCQSFSELVKRTLGKGATHAALIYHEFFQRGTISSQNPAFNNAKRLYEEIVALTDFSPPVISNQKSDGVTDKILIYTEDQLEIETVLIPMQAGGTLCVSSQIGCRMGCLFCETGRMGLLRNLKVEEIVAQVFIARHILGLEVRNVVFMGMGEPFDNYSSVMNAVHILSDPHGLAIGRKHITISTSGCIEGIEKLMHEKEGPNLAVSINAPDDLTRNRLMPVNRKHDMQKLYEAMALYCNMTKQQIFIAYVLLKDRNDSLEQADLLAQYLKGLDVKVNLIPYNPQSCDRFQPPDIERIEAFTQRLRNHGYYTLLRMTKGQGIMAACGQLGNASLRKSIKLPKI